MCARPIKGVQNPSCVGAAIIAENICKRQGNFSMDIDRLAIDDKKITGIIGANGSGKSTLARILAGLLAPDSGSITCSNNMLAKQDITLIPQKPYMMRDTVLANLMYPLKLRKIAVRNSSRPPRKPRNAHENVSESGSISVRLNEFPQKSIIDDFLQLAGLENMKNTYAPSLSSGEAQKLALIRAMIFKPKVIFVDETFSNMDMKSQLMFENFILDGQKNSPIAWVIISHQMATIKRLCNFVHFMDGGSVIESGETQQIFTSPVSDILKSYLQLMGIGGVQD